MHPREPPLFTALYTIITTIFSIYLNLTIVSLAACTLLLTVVITLTIAMFVSVILIHIGLLIGVVCAIYFPLSATFKQNEKEAALRRYIRGERVVKDSGMPGWEVVIENGIMQWQRKESWW
jgi:hypothetical protein